MFATSSSRPALVSRKPVQPSDPVEYLIAADGDRRWTYDPLAATAFASMKEATRAALHLPGTLRAFGLPLQPELIVRRDLH
jgi:hypothetical protein